VSVRPFRLAASVAAVALLLAAFLSGGSPARSQDEPSPVTIFNTPLPVTATKEAPVAVELADPTAPLPVSGAGGAPVSVLVSPDGPFQFQGTAGIPAGEPRITDSFDVPVGSLLVIEYVTVRGYVPDGQKVRSLLRVTTDGVDASHSLVDYAQGDMIGSGKDTFSASHLVRFYADPGSTVLIRVDRSANNGLGGFWWTISGYLVPA
jgi:hypothetical protein